MRVATDWGAVKRYAQLLYIHLRNEGSTCHPSFDAEQALAAAATEFNVGYGTAGFCDDCGHYGVTYINMGDPCVTTVLFESDKERFSVGCWGDIVESAPEGRYP